MSENEMVFYPQDEMNTVLIPVTIGCSYNKCAFCSMYKDNSYSQVSLGEIEQNLMNSNIYTERIFLTGADPLSIGFENMKLILEMIRKYIPYCACVAAYASVNNILMYSVAELSELHNLGLRMLYIGFETGRNDILKLMKKSHTLEVAIEQAKKLNEVKLQFNSILMYGIAGADECKKNAIITAEMMNQFITNRIIMMNLTVFHGTELKEMILRNEFKIPDRKERLLELKILIENLLPLESTVFDTTHPTNIIKIKGVLPEDRNKLINIIKNKI